jgi:DNA-binding NarL/FixJ family response regulator
MSQESTSRHVSSVPFRILIADDHAIVRRGVRALLEGEDGLEISDEVADGAAVIEYVKKNRPHLVILDLTLPGINGLDVLRELHESVPETQIAILTMHFSVDVGRSAFQAGAQSYVLKSDADIDLLKAVQCARKNKRYFTEKLDSAMIDSLVAQDGPVNPEEIFPVPGVALTARELDIVRLLGAGMSNKQIASEVGLSIRTVESHRNHIMHKMKFKSFSQLIRFAVRHHLVDP